MRINSILKNSTFRSGIDEKPPLKPLPAAIGYAAVYIILLSIYIWLSDTLAADVSATVEELKRIELIKGLLFVLATGIGLFLCSFMTFREIERKYHILISQNKSLVSSERVVLAGIFSSSLCHDINNIMAIIVGNAELLELSENIDEKERENINQILAASKNLTDLTTRMMAAGNGHIPGEKKPVDICQVILDTIEFAKIHKKIKNCRLQHDLPPTLTVEMNAALFSRALMNLILNAAEASDGPVQICVKILQNDDSVTVEVHDSGGGVPKDIREKIFEPFYTSKTDGNGLGLLSLKICAEHHNGTVQLKNSYLGGVCFCLTLPLNREKAQPEPPAP